MKTVRKYLRVDEQKSSEDWLALVNELQATAADEDATIQEQN